MTDTITIPRAVEAKLREKNTQPQQEPNPIWIGCGACDPKFPCYDGLNKCIRN